MRVLFFGTPDFAVPSLEALVASPHTVVGCITQPDRPSGRGHRVVASPIKMRAAAHSLPLWQPERLRDDRWLAEVGRLEPDLAVVAAYGKILPESVITLPRLGTINVHASLLPAWRGASPVQHAVMAGDRTTGVTIMRIVKALDAGPMLARVVRSIGPDETAGDVEDDLARLGARLLVEVVDAIAAGTATEQEQDHARATYAPRLVKDDGLIDWMLPAPTLHNRVRGLQPWPLAFTWLGPARTALLKVRPSGDAPETRLDPGTVAHAHGDRLVVAAGAGTLLEILEVRPEGKRTMSAREFLAGHRVMPGSRVGTRPT